MVPRSLALAVALVLRLTLATRQSAWQSEGPAPAPAVAPGPAPAPSTAPAAVVSTTLAPVVNKTENVTNVTGPVLANASAVPPLKPDTLSEEAMDAANPTFADLDCLKADGFVTVDEAATYGVKNGVPWSEIKPIFKVVDGDGDHQISKAEFDAGKPTTQKMIQDFRASFRALDLNSDSLIDNQEWLAFCDGWMTPKPGLATCEELFKAADRNAPKGEIDRQEFEEAGRHCATVDDGDCALLQTALVSLGSRPSRGLRRPAASLAATRSSAAQLFGDVVREYRSKRADRRARL